MAHPMKQLALAAGVIATLAVGIGVASSRLEHGTRQRFGFPVHWAVAYPNLFGNLMIRGVRVGSSDVLVAQSVEADLRWSSLFSERVEANRLEISEILGTFTSTDPVEIARAILHARGGGGRRGAKSGGDDESMAEEGSAGSGAKALLVHAFEVESGSLILATPDRPRITINNIRLSGKNLSVPLVADLDASATFDVAQAGATEEPNELPSARPQGSYPVAYPVAAKFVWSRESESALLTLTLTKFPLALLDQLFPGTFNPLRGAPMLSSGDSSMTNGSMSGMFTLRLSPKGGSSSWSLVER